MLLSHRAFTAFFFLALAAMPALAHAEAPTLTSYTVSPETIYVQVPEDSILATTTTISFGFSERVKVSLKVVDDSGAGVKTLYTSSGVTNPEPKQWDGTDAAGEAVPAGTYRLYLSATSTETGEALTDTSKTITVAISGGDDPPPPGITFTVPLSPSWNLISLPVTPERTDPRTVLGDAESSINSVWTYDPEDPSANSSGWLVYDPLHPEISNLSRMTSGHGYFVHAKGAISLSGSGSLFPIGGTPPERSLEKGWSLVGAFVATQQEITDAFSSIGLAGIEYTALWKLNADSQEFETPSAVRPGEGFWIYLDAPHTYVPANL